MNINAPHYASIYVTLDYTYYSKTYYTHHNGKGIHHYVCVHEPSDDFLLNDLRHTSQLYGRSAPCTS